MDDANKRIGNTAAEHLYEVEVVKWGEKSKIEVSANTRSQAETIAHVHGYVVRSINMVG